MFYLDQFVADCRAAIVRHPSHMFVRKVVGRAVSDPGAVLNGIGKAKARSNSFLAEFFSHYWQRHGSTNVRHAMR
jgi:hypothetical protein